MAYNTEAILTDKNGNPIPQYYDVVTDSFLPMGKDFQLSESLMDRRGLNADKPAARADLIGVTYWSVDTDPNAEAIELCNGTSWVVMA